MDASGKAGQRLSMRRLTRNSFARLFSLDYSTSTALLAPMSCAGMREMMTITLFESLEAIRAFAGNEPTLAHVTTEARQLLSRFEHTVTHYEVVLAP